MSFKLALSAGHGLYTAGKRCLQSLDPNETREWWLNDRIADRIEVLLKEYEGIEVKRLDDTTGKTDVSLSKRSNQANAWKADFYLAVHHNAGINGGTGGGITAYAYNGSVPQATLDWQEDLYNELIKLTGLKGNRSNGCPRANLHECREPYMNAVLLELGFMDSSTDVPIILTQDFAYKCAQACVNVIVKKAGLKKKSITPVKPTTTNTYKLVVDVNKYSTSADAKSRNNSKGTMKAGTYYIFNKYPNGYSGMYNLTTDSTGTEAGAWINPAENVVKEVKEEVQKLYRVRLSWSDTKSQKGAYSSLDNAKKCCQDAGSGYKVFDWNGKEVYSYIAPTPVEPTPTPVQPEEEKKVYELTFPITHKICDEVTVDEDYEKKFTQVCESILKNNPSFDIEIVRAFFKLAPIYKIDPIRAISQSILETGWFNYRGSAVLPEHHNYCGLGVTVNGKPGNIFDTIENGVRAQLQHLFAYGSKDTLPTGENLVDQRFKYVTRGIAPTWEQLAGRWAVPGFDGGDPEVAIKNGTTYGQKIDKIYNELLSFNVTEEMIKKYFPEVNPIDPEPVEPQPIEPENGDKSQFKSIINVIIELIKFIINLFKK